MLGRPDGEELQAASRNCEWHQELRRKKIPQVLLQYQGTEWCQQPIECQWEPWILDENSVW